MKKYARIVIPDIVACLIMAATMFFLFINANPYKRGFFCSDTSIRYPFLASTIPSWMLWIYAVFLPIFTIIAFQCYQFKISNNSSHPLLWQLYCEVRPFVFGGLSSQLMVDTAKYTIGRLRPHFFTICRPNIQCNPTFYYDNFECNPPIGITDSDLTDARLSFMSGHSSLSMFAMIYLILFLHQRLPANRYGFARPTIQLALLTVAIYTGYTRVSNYKHHWSDVLAGYVNGLFFALFTSVYIGQLNSSRKSKYYDLNEEITNEFHSCPKTSTVELQHPNV